MIALLAPAKLNLGLRVLARRPDGYHEIETLLVPLRLFDRLELSAGHRPGITLDVDTPAVPDGRENLAVRAAEGVCTYLGREPRLHIRLEKRIPVAAGLGGGSSDAAAAIYGTERLLGERLPPGERAALALRLGADVPFFLDPRPALARGVGELLEPLTDVPEMTWLLVAFDFPVSTADVYRAVAGELTLPRQGSSIAALLGPSGIRSSPPNDLETITARLHPEIRGVRRMLERAGARVTGMSGSGPTVYGRFGDERAAESAARSLELPAGAKAIVVSSAGSGSNDGDGA